ncbi:MAG: HD domain-containing protein [Candidatus Microsaccharimonas sp.]
MTKETFDVKKVLITLQNMLVDIARDLIVSSHDMSDPLQQGLKADPDSPAEHSPSWHQYGILTHSENFQKILAFEIPKLMEEWNIPHEVTSVLSDKIEGVSKGDLLQIASLLHDLGKFTSRTFEYQEDGAPLARFVGHEADSGSIIRVTLNDTLKKVGLHNEQIEYIAVCAEHHFDLGNAREVAKDSGGYTIAYAKSTLFEEAALAIMNRYPNIALEIGLMFIADSLSKTEVAAVADTDDGITTQKGALQEVIKHKGLDPRLINQALQQPVNIEIGKQYLQLLSQRRKAR